MKHLPLVFGIGIDIEEIDRFVELKDQPQVLKKFFTQNELDYCMKKKNFAQHLAVRYAAKEAVYKALSAVPGAGLLAHHQIEVTRNRKGVPGILVHHKKIKDTQLQVSLSHSRSNAVAVCIRLT